MDSATTSCFSSRHNVGQKKSWNFFTRAKRKVSFSTTGGSREMQAGRGSARRDIPDKRFRRILHDFYFLH
jgi:hypothetical protein